ncbi:MAG: hypothetical protein PVI86_15710 [Phycisphaerae bacterium]
MCERRLLRFGAFVAVITVGAGYAVAIDTDGDGVADGADACCHTPLGIAVDGEGRPLWDLDEDCDADLGDYAFGHPLWAIDYFARFSRNFTGSLPGDGPCEMAHDDCASPAPVLNGTTEFSNVGATTDGPDEPGACDFFAYTHIESDIWLCYTTTCNGNAVASLCGSGYDTKVAVYDGCGCPASQPVACNDDGCGPLGGSSRVTFPVQSGRSYMVRIGGFHGSEGDGVITLFCENDTGHGLNACRPGTGNCFVANGTPGCASISACEAVCALDLFCCDTAWDEVCAELADGLVNGFDECHATAGSCFSANGTPGCDDVSCCQAVCESDPFCCLNAWDALCASAVGPVCGMFAACVNGVGSCFVAHANPGCSNEACCNAVCNVDAVCCNDGWDELCADRATQDCE